LPVPSFPELYGKGTRIFGYSLLDLSPGMWAVLVFYADNAVNDTVNFPLILLGDRYAGFLEDLLKMPEITGQNRCLLNILDKLF